MADCWATEQRMASLYMEDFKVHDRAQQTLARVKATAAGVTAPDIHVQRVKSCPLPTGHAVPDRTHVRSLPFYLRGLRNLPAVSVKTVLLRLCPYRDGAKGLQML